MASSFSFQVVSYLGEPIVHDGWDEFHPLGRRLRVRGFRERVPVGSVDLAAEAAGPSETQTTTYYDDFGRPLRVEQPLGEDYAGDVVIANDVTYDAMGRVLFRATPYLASEAGTERYGTTYSYRENGDVHCEVSAYGITPWGSTTDDTSIDDERYVQCAARQFKNHTEELTLLSPNAYLPGAPQAGAYDRVYQSAIGQQIEHRRGQGTDILERSHYAYDRLGNRTHTRRYEDPATLVGVVRVGPCVRLAGSAAARDRARALSPNPALRPRRQYGQ